MPDRSPTAADVGHQPDPVSSTTQRRRHVVIPAEAARLAYEQGRALPDAGPPQTGEQLAQQQEQQ